MVWDTEDTSSSTDNPAGAFCNQEISPSDGLLSLFGAADKDSDAGSVHGVLAPDPLGAITDD